ncbi:MAG: hypothetical protein IPG08_03890 [Sphingobacteriaceae bacterium]|nr:hypothetical protein [Sphingobacteriaceae bacterium]
MEQSFTITPGICIGNSYNNGYGYNNIRITTVIAIMAIMAGDIILMVITMVTILTTIITVMATTNLGATTIITGIILGAISTVMETIITTGVILMDKTRTVVITMDLAQEIAVKQSALKSCRHGGSKRSRNR